MSGADGTKVVKLLAEQITNCAGVMCDGCPVWLCVERERADPHSCLDELFLNGQVPGEVLWRQGCFSGLPNEAAIETAFQSVTVAIDECP